MNITQINTNSSSDVEPYVRIRPLCFKCEKPIEAAVQVERDRDYWDAPCGVLFHGGSNFGSAIYDGLVDGIEVQIIVCDDCLKKHKAMLREIQRDRHQWRKCTECVRLSERTREKAGDQCP